MKPTKLLAIEQLLAHLELARRGWVVQDHWEGDQAAIGIAAGADRSRLVYVSVYGKEHGKYDFECEFAPTAEGEAYRTGSRGEDVEMDELLRVLAAHLGSPPSSEPASSSEE